jgi:hypothetical protein
MRPHSGILRLKIDKFWGCISKETFLVGLKKKKERKTLQSRNRRQRRRRAKLRIPPLIRKRRSLPLPVTQRWS